ncbi:hypothetical protein ON010_g3754 [Phytophthora cinnamomi]|nr:hypothetical protein ON010_g3754 [Phytophthora cinnamomi]
MCLFSEKLFGGLKNPYYDYVAKGRGIKKSESGQRSQGVATHHEICVDPGYGEALARAEDSATGEDGGSIADFAATTANQKAPLIPALPTRNHPSGDSSNDDDDAKPLPSHQQCFNIIKLLRDERAIATADSLATDRATNALLQRARRVRSPLRNVSIEWRL